MSLTDVQEEPKETDTAEAQPPEAKDYAIVKAKQ